ncbi:conserved Plasmodium protein, unknown function [Plasmodium berghei]|uniref:Uncharacterized protein n=2 Tax=Plasmodium berghei TaxID=5821 RepID=A0A509AEK9_PLABA|nr:conserved Plasmodium protein, unknown function [Plasmodium berghei ANKA]CXI12901.1 conserved Plasmodium protein, unknown function [Plasmodium berghei]SCL93417.1 conserved Plasmodium protein, unknown function [Plasmodium berghei]SCM15859.1 conserved Plasmodium protein, unknown function [Plasmodium berghei]SCM17655.1 conserved Plasmodium protein, unknown function [Plasmodium berghei]SCN23188.1 conserved Plasmodium protein, unknown function [Plasmodium berghei]|eukprot:XP_034420463.1 conserved Plasmodium protein, unknown function [Plasmodium berghei ANKA]
MAFCNNEDTHIGEISYNDCSYNSDTTASAYSSSSENIHEIQIKIKRVIENRILNETKKTGKRKLHSCNKNSKKIKSMKIEEMDNCKIIARKKNFFNGNQIRESENHIIHLDGTKNDYIN